MHEHDPAFGHDLGPGPWRWLVFWGAIGRPGVRSETVEAYDAAEALSRAAEQFPELPAPRVAVLARQERA